MHEVKSASEKSAPPGRARIRENTRVVLEKSSLRASRWCEQVLLHVKSTFRTSGLELVLHKDRLVRDLIGAGAAHQRHHLIEPFGGDRHECALQQLRPTSGGRNLVWGQTPQQ